MLASWDLSISQNVANGDFVLNQLNSSFIVYDDGFSAEADSLDFNVAGSASWVSVYGFGGSNHLWQFMEQDHVDSERLKNSEISTTAL